MKYLYLGIFICLMSIFSSCGSSYYIANLNSRGSEPNSKSFYITSSDSSIIKSLEFQEYSQSLKERLEELGYIESSPSTASVVVILDYQLGDSYLAKFSTQNTSSTTSNSRTLINKNVFGSSKAISSTYSSNNTNSDTVNTYMIPLIVSISAYNNFTADPIWEVIVRDNLYRETQLQSVMPWLFLSAQPYFGKSSHGEVTTKVQNSKVIRDTYDFVWPY